MATQLKPIEAPEPFLVSITIPGPPTAKGRPRFSSAGKFVRTYTPAKTRRYEDLIRCEAADAMGDRPPLDEPCSVTITAYVPIPKGFSKAKRIDASAGVIKPVTRPDCDNYAKLIDGLNAIVFRDDNLVTDLIVRKRYSERPRLVITVTAGEDYA